MKVMETATLTRTYVYDPVLRLIHAVNALLVVLLILTSQLATALEFSWEVAALWRLHLWCGYGLFLGLTARLVWGLTGPEHARWAALWQPKAWLDALRRRAFFTPPQALGHHPVASLAYLVLYLLLVVMVCTGLALAAIDQGQGPLYAWLGDDLLRKPLFRTPHDWLEEWILAFVIVHLAALILHERRHGLPVAQAMVSGFQYRRHNG